MSEEYLLQMTGIHKRFGGVHALNDVNFRVRPGKVMCLAGENGCGKSTLVKIISGVYTKDEGTVTLRDEVRGQGNHQDHPCRSHPSGYSGHLPGPVYLPQPDRP